MVDYRKLTEELKKHTEDEFELTHDDLEKILGGFPKVYYKGGFTQKSALGKAILKSGHTFSNSNKNKKVIFEKDPEKANNLLNNNDVKGSNIILNVLFSNKAEYINAKGNIGHEIIDIFAGDNNEYHYYLNPDGIVKETNKPDCIISISQVSTGLYKILNKAIIDRVEDGATDKEEGYKKQSRKYKYNGKFLEGYFSQNPSGNTVLSSYFCSGIYEPSKELFIAFKTFKHDMRSSNIYKLTSTSPGRSLRFSKFSESDIKTLEGLVNESDNWNKDPIGTFSDYVKNYKPKNNFTYFKELGIEKNELSYSNALRFFLDSNSLTNDFLKWIGCDVNESDEFNVIREYFNIDLLFLNFNILKDRVEESKEQIIIIENKIKSYITPAVKQNTIEEQIKSICSQIDESSSDSLFNRIKDILKINIDEKGCPSQLSKYYIWSLALALKRGWDNNAISNNIKCFFLCPNYSKNLYQVLESGYLYNNSLFNADVPLFLQEKYKLITYENVYKFFLTNKKKVKSNKHLFRDFVNAVFIHAKDRDTILEDKMIDMFYSHAKNRKH